MADEKKPAEQKEPEPYVVKHDLPKKELVAPDGHVNLSQEDIDNRA